MKKFVLFSALLMAMCQPVYASGVTGYYQQMTLMDAATGTTAAVLKPFTLDYPASMIACDLIAGPTTTTENITFSVSGNQGSSSTLFDTGTVYLITTKTIATSTTATVMKTYATVNVPFRTLSASVTRPTYTANRTTVNCTVMQ